MGTTIYKVGDDQYVIWSSVVEAPTMWGTRAELTGYLVNDGIAELQRSIGERFARTDEHGTSSLVYRRHHESGEMFEQKGVLKIEHLAQFISSYDPVAETFDESWIDPIDDPDFIDRRVARESQNGPHKIPVA